MLSMIKKNSILRILRNPGLLAIALILSAALSAQAQGVGSSRGLASGDGIHTIQGRLYFPATQPANGKSLKIILESSSSSAMGGSSTMTDLDGSFRFNNLRPGGYTVVVDGGKEYETVRERVEIFPAGTGGQIAQVNIQLRLKAGAANPALAGVPQNALDLYEKGTEAAQKGNSKEAAEFLSKAVTAYANFPIALNELGLQYLKLRQWDKAAQTYDALIKLKPADAAAQLNLGVALYNIGTGLVVQQNLDEAQKKLDGAEAHLREAIKLNSPGPGAHYYLGLTLMQFKAYDEAQKEMELAISNGGDNLAQAHRYLGGLYQRAHKNKEAADELEKYLKLDPKAKDADTIKGIIEKLRKS